jgi:CheY-like chemotaxis protein
MRAVLSQSPDIVLEQETRLVMIVDDSNDIRDMVSYMLGASGYRVIEAVNGEEALRLAQKECPDLILMDLSMPILDGFGATRALRETAEMCKVPIVAISAHDTTDHRAKAVAVGFDEYLAKPLDLNRLINLIRNLLPEA